MKTMRSVLAAAGLTALLFCGACSALQAEADRSLSDYSKLTAHPDVPGAQRYIAPPEVLGRYHKLLIEPFSLRPGFRSDLGKVSRADSRELLDALRDRMAEIVGQRYAVVTQPGGDVLRLRAAVTDLKFEGATRDPAHAVGATYEAEVVDSVTGEQIGAVVRTFDAPEGQNAFDAMGELLLKFMNDAQGAK
jgi:hypothetical protein